MMLLVVFGVMLLFMAAMAVGVMFGRQPIQGSCGGVGKFGLSGECEFCGGDPAKCEEGELDTSAVQEEGKQALAYDATRAGKPAERGSD